MRRVVSCLVLILSLTIAGTGDACTIFNASRGGVVLVGNNEDWHYSTNPKVWFEPKTEKSHGRMLFGWDQMLFVPFAQGGMNDQGLFFDWAWCPEARIFSLSSLWPSVHYFFNSDKLLADCATVEEALAWLGNYKKLYTTSHMMLVDKGGNSAVVEWVHGEQRIIRKTGDYQVMTNFWLSQPDLGQRSIERRDIDRYDTVDNVLKSGTALSRRLFSSILQNVSLYGRSEKDKEVGTLYSNVYNLKTGDVTIYYKRDFKNAVTINLKDQLKKGRHSYELKDLFSKDKSKRVTP